MLLALVAIAALTPLHHTSPQDTSHFCLSRALEHGRLTIDDCIGNVEDRSRYDGHLYSNKAPGFSVLATPVVAAVGLRPPTVMHVSPTWRLWLVRVLTSGLAFVACAFLVGRVAEGLAPARGPAVLVTFAIGTLAAPFAATGFDHVLTATLAFGAFLLAWRRRALPAGLVAGAALLCEYEAAIVVVAVALYLMATAPRDVLRYGLGVLPGAALLAAYDWVAFGAPWRMPLRYSDNRYRSAHEHGLLGVNVPDLHGLRVTLGWPLGLLVGSPVALAALAGLVLLWRRGLRAEAAMCIGVTLAFVVSEAGFFDPIGGWSPGPRFLVPALPFLLIGLAPALQRAPLPSLVLAGASVVATTALTQVWSVHIDFPHTIWPAIARVPIDGTDSLLAHVLPHNALDVIVDDPLRAAAICAIAAAAAFVVALTSLRPSPTRSSSSR